MINSSKTTWLVIVLVIALCATGVFIYQWWQTKGELAKQIEGKPEEEPAVTITTDKTEYEQGEEIEITIRNGLDKPIWYMEEGCPSCCGLYKWEDNKWKSLGPIRFCIMYTWPYIPKPDKLRSGKEIEIKWNMKMPGEEEFIRSGIYKFSFSFGLTKDSHNEKIAYSNEFIIK